MIATGLSCHPHGIQPHSTAAGTALAARAIAFTAVAMQGHPWRIAATGAALAARRGMATTAQALSPRGPR